MPVSVWPLSTRRSVLNRGRSGKFSRRQKNVKPAAYPEGMLLWPAIVTGPSLSRFSHRVRGARRLAPPAGRGPLQDVRLTRAWLSRVLHPRERAVPYAVLGTGSAPVLGLHPLARGVSLCPEVSE
ncbi:hypothetical protein SAMN00790413_01762 [Deinococcus hopiensis KR-140]|uniref:Uncharacterized protein n=1 Tax=Deinococcus hopiensis KR-140 TaxID=695939 RepID=A0A1W1VHR9_9DEIO|nr:hypothetical protein SAMN00790413_01762 [Deinococcus hopiensis KR-140]